MEEKGFKEWLKVNTNLMETTINLYSRTLNRFLNEYGEPTIENINRFVSDSFREKNSCYVKYPFRLYLKFIGQEDLYKDIVPVKVNPRKKTGIFLKKEELLEIVRGTVPETYRTVALVQLCTGARASEVLAFKKADLIQKGDGVMMKLIAKRGKEVIKHIPPRFQEEILGFLDKARREFPFLRGQYAGSIKRVVSNNYRYYYASVKRSATKLGHPSFATHDFRRNFADHLQQKDFNIRNIQKAMGHSRIETTLRYLDESKETHKEATEVLWGD